MDFLLFVLACWGMTQILVFGRIFDRIRPKHQFFHCAMCMGFWVGALVFLGFWLGGVHLFPNPWLGSFLGGCVSSATSFALTSLFRDGGLYIKRQD